ncbi:MAG: alpha/beta fold hydrolase [Dehalococcoidales bacterium]
MLAKLTEDTTAGITSLELEINGRRAHYLKAGSGPPVVLLHGGASDSRDWLGAMVALSQHFTCYAPDLIGFGRNERDEAGYYLSDFIEFIEDFIIALRLDNPDIIGHSFGGRVGAGIALRGRVKTRKLVLVDSSGLGKVTRFGSSLMTVFWTLRQLFHRPQPYPRFLVKEGEDTRWLCVDALPALKNPTLIMWKRHDPYFPVSQAHRAANLIAGARLEILPGFGHAPSKQNIEAFNRLLLDFLNED